MSRPKPPGQAHLSRTLGSTVFGTDIQGYARARIGYPAELYDVIKARSRADMRVLEIGPGTGLATQDILEKLAPTCLTAVEPDAGFVRHLAQAFSDPRLQTIHSDFLAAPIEGTFDLACCAAAFHWLDPKPTYAKLREVITPQGTLAIWWNSYRQPGIGDEFSDAVMPLLADIPLAPSEGPKGHYSLDVDTHRSAFRQAGFTAFEPHLFRRERQLDSAQLRELYASYSYVRALPDGRRMQLLDAIVELAEQHFAGTVTNVVLTALYLGTNAV